jgi:hypothetical protein
MVEVLGEIEAFEQNLSGTAKVGLAFSSAHGPTILIFFVGFLDRRLVCIGHMKKIGLSLIMFQKCWGVGRAEGQTTCIGCLGRS